MFALLTLLSALSLAGVSGWFSIIGITSIYAGAPLHAMIMGVVLESGKLVTTSWLYRNWQYASWKLKIPLIFFTITLMLITSIGVFGYLSKIHLEQDSGTIDNTAKIERLDEQITREKSIISDDQKVIDQLDATINSYIGKDRTDRSVSVRRSQAPQRKQLRDEIDSAQKQIDDLSNQKLELGSQLRKLQLDVGPIRYIADLFYGQDSNQEKNIEAAVRIFTLIIVSVLDPLAVILLIAANHTILRLKNEKEEKNKTSKSSDPILDRAGQPNQETVKQENDSGNEAESVTSGNDGTQNRSDNYLEDSQIYPKILPEIIPDEKEENKENKECDSISTKLHEERNTNTFQENHEKENSDQIFGTNVNPERLVSDKISILEMLKNIQDKNSLSKIKTPIPTRVDFRQDEEVEDFTEEIIYDSIPTPQLPQHSRIRELLGETPHFVPQKLNENQDIQKTAMELIQTVPEAEKEAIQEMVKEELEEVLNNQKNDLNVTKSNKYPYYLSWLTEFKGNNNGNQ